jgi:hypothetical protein
MWLTWPDSKIEKPLDVHVMSFQHCIYEELTLVGWSTKVIMHSLTGGGNQFLGISTKYDHIIPIQIGFVP